MRGLGWLVGAMALWSGTAMAGPSLLPVQGRIVDNAGVALSGPKDVTFRLYDFDSVEVFEEVQTVEFVDGRFTAYLGEVSTLNTTLFQAYPELFLGITVAGDTEAELVPLGSVPYAGHADMAADATLFGGLPPSEYKPVEWVPDWLEVINRPAGLDDGDDNTTYGAGEGLALSGTTFSVDAAAIEDLARGVCIEDVDEALTAFDGVYRPAGNVPWAELDDRPAGLDDGDDDTIFTAGEGLLVDGESYTVDQDLITTWIEETALDSDALVTALTGQVRFLSDPVSWADVDDTTLPAGLADGDDDTQYTSGAGLVLNGTEFSVDSAAIEDLAKGVCYDNATELNAVLDSRYLLTPGTGLVQVGQTLSVAQATVEGWARGVSFDSELELITALDDNYVVGAGTGLTKTGNTLAVNQATVEGWARGVAIDSEAEMTTLLDDNYVVGAGAGLTKTGNTLAVNQTTVEGWARGVAIDSEAEMTTLLDDNYVITAGAGITKTGNSVAVNQTTIEGWARGVAIDNEAEMTALLNDNYVSAAGADTQVNTAFADMNNRTLSWGGLMALPADHPNAGFAASDLATIRAGRDAGEESVLFIMTADNVNDSVYIGGGVQCCSSPNWQGLRVFGNGNASLSGTMSQGVGAQFADVAERVPVDEGIEAGDVVSVDAEAMAYPATAFVKTHDAYDARAVGVISDSAVLTMGQTDGRSPLALTGFVKVKVDASFGAVKPGDLLTSSPTPGHAMVATDDRPGTIIGKALEPLNDGTGRVLMLVMNR